MFHFLLSQAARLQRHEGHPVHGGRAGRPAVRCDVHQPRVGPLRPHPLHPGVPHAHVVPAPGAAWALGGRRNPPPLIHRGRPRPRVSGCDSIIILGKMFWENPQRSPKGTGVVIGGRTQIRTYRIGRMAVSPEPKMVWGPGRCRARDAEAVAVRAAVREPVPHLRHPRRLHQPGLRLTADGPVCAGGRREVARPGHLQHPGLRPEARPPAPSIPLSSRPDGLCRQGEGAGPPAPDPVGNGTSSPYLTSFPHPSGDCPGRAPAILSSGAGPRLTPFLPGSPGGPSFAFWAASALRCAALHCRL